MVIRIEQLCCLLCCFSNGKSITCDPGNPSSPIWLDDVNCAGTEASLTECSNRGWGVEDCSHVEDAGCRCYYGNDGRGVATHCNGTHT